LLLCKNSKLRQKFTIKDFNFNGMAKHFEEKRSPELASSLEEH